MQEKKENNFSTFLFSSISAFVVRVCVKNIFVVLRVEFFSHQCTNTYFDDAHKYYNKNSITSIYFSLKKKKSKRTQWARRLFGQFVAKMGPFFAKRPAFEIYIFYELKNTQIIFFNKSEQRCRLEAPPLFLPAILLFICVAEFFRIRLPTPTLTHTYLLFEVLWATSEFHLQCVLEHILKDLLQLDFSPFPYFVDFLFPSCPKHTHSHSRIPTFIYVLIYIMDNFNWQQNIKYEVRLCKFLIEKKNCPKKCFSTTKG